MKYVIVIESVENGFSAYVPDLPGCVTVGESREEVEGHIQEAILLHLEGMNEDGLEIPKPTTEAVTMLIPNVA
ncbi:MAG: type II toxin-antitoxin system HicB family antitoxin [Balneolaceae bacterium]|nr:type II toxin-antitoxin system HicB family antitoxin [Balneolaceae bacterium]